MSVARPGSRGAALFLHAFLLFALAACGGGPPHETAPGAATENAAADGTGDGDRTGRDSAPAQKGADVAALPPQSVDPARLSGLTREKVRELLGQPAFVRRESVAEFWRYRHRTCILELYFYEKGGAQVLDHLETREAGRDPAVLGRCIGALVAARRAG